MAWIFGDDEIRDKEREKEAKREGGRVKENKATRDARPPTTESTDANLCELFPLFLNYSLFISLVSSLSRERVSFSSPVFPSIA